MPAGADAAADDAAADDAVAGAAAVVDCGTNSTRLLVVGADGATRERLMVITRLGRGVDRTRRLDPAAIEATLAVLRDFRAVMDSHGVTTVRAAATSAVRDAANGREFLDRAGAVLGSRPELLSGSEEGRLSFRGATALLPPDGNGPVLVADIGGGSTELVLGRPDAPDAAVAVSVDVGCVRITERFLASDPPTPAELQRARGAIDDALDRAAAALAGADAGVSPAERLVGLAGTVSAAAVMDAGAAEYSFEVVHHRMLERTRMHALLERLAAMDNATRRGVRGLEEARADIIVGGLLVLVAVMERFGCESCLASEADILDGLVSTVLPPGRAHRTGA